MEDVVVGILAIGDVHVKTEFPSTSSDITKIKHLVVTIGEVSGHRVLFGENTVFGTARSVAPSGPRITVGLSNLSAGHAVVEIEAHLCESIAKNKGNHRNE